MTEIITAAPRIDPEAEITRLAQRHDAAGGFGIQLLNIIGGQVDGLIDRLPRDVRDQLGQATHAALVQALAVASRSRRIVPDQSPWMNRAGAFRS